MGFRIYCSPFLGGPEGLLVGPAIMVLASLDEPAAQHVIAHELVHAINDRWGSAIRGSAAFVEALIDAIAVQISGG